MDFLVKEFKCGSCRKKVMVSITQSQWNDLVTNRKKIQDIFPELSADDREIMISNICGSCFDKLFCEDDY